MGIRREGTPRLIFLFLRSTFLPLANLFLSFLLGPTASYFWYQSQRGDYAPARSRDMSTRSGAEFRAGTSPPVHPEDIPDWAKSLLQSQEETKIQIEFLMAQLLELKTTKPADVLPLANAAHNDALHVPAPEEQKEDSPWDVAKCGAKPEVAAFDGSLDPKKFMAWEAGLDEYFDWYQLPEGRRIQFAQMKLTEQAMIYWRNTQSQWSADTSQ